MEEALKECIKTTPAFSALVILVALFLKFLTKMMELHANRTNEFLTTMRTISDDNRDARNKSNDVIQKNTTALASIETLLSEVLHQRGNQRGH